MNYAKKDKRKKKAKEGANMEMIDNQSGIEVENRIERLENRNEDLVRLHFLLHITFLILQTYFEGTKSQYTR